MNDIQKFFYDRMILALYEAQSELIVATKSKDMFNYYSGNIDDNLPAEIVNSATELQAFVKDHLSSLQSNVDVSVKYRYLHARELSGLSIFTSTVINAD